MYFKGRKISANVTLKLLYNNWVVYTFIYITKAVNLEPVKETENNIALKKI